MMIWQEATSSSCAQDQPMSDARATQPQTSSLMTDDNTKFWSTPYTCSTHSVVIVNVRSMRVMCQQNLWWGGGFSGHGERPFHLHPSTDTITHAKWRRIFSFTRPMMTAPLPHFHNQWPAINGQQQEQHPSTAAAYYQSHPHAIRTTPIKQWDGINRQTCPRACHPEPGPTKPIRDGR